MYRITCDGITLYKPDNPVLQLISGTLKTGQNIAGTLTFVLAPTHPYLSRIKARSSVISVYRDGALYFRGSPLNVTESDTGLVTVTAEGALAWLGDSVQPFAEYHNMTVRTYLETLVQNHNVAVQDDAYKQFTVGEVTVTDSNDSLYRHSNFEHTKDAITEKLTKRLGGILRVRWKNSVQYLDYLAEYKHVNGQGIKFGQNLLTYARSVPTANLATAIIPLGCKLTDADGNETDERLQIDNGGKNYVWDEKAVQEFGWIFDTIICDDVTLKENLSKRGYSELEARKVLPTTIKLTAVDFGALGGNYERITVGDLLPIVSAPHSLDTYMTVAEMTENLVDPGKSTVTLNRTYKTVTNKLFNSTPKDGKNGKKGEDATLLRIESSRGTVFKNDSISTVLSAVIYHGKTRITDVDALRAMFGSGAYLQWRWQRLDESEFGVISAVDSRIGAGGFTFTLSPDDVDTKVTFMCELII